MSTTFSPAPMGGYNDTSVSDSDVVAAAKFAVDREYPSGTVTYVVLRARIQIVAGTNYELQVAITEVATRVCIVKTYVVFRSLPNTSGSVTFSLTSSVKDESTICPSTPSYTSSPYTGPPMGGYNDISVSDPGVVAAAKFAVDREYPSGTVTYVVLRARIQIVAGTNYELQVAITEVATRVCIVKTYVVFRSLPNASGSVTFSLTSSIKDESTICPVYSNTSATPSSSFAATPSSFTNAPSSFTNAPSSFTNAPSSFTNAPTPNVTMPVNTNASSFATPFATTTPFVTTAATPAAAKTASLDDVDPNGYIRLALSSLHSGQTQSALNNIYFAINVQTRKGNYASVAMLRAAVLYTQAIINPLLNNFGIPASKLSDAVSYMLVGTILITLCMVNGTSSAIYYNVRQALLALNSSVPNVTTASAFVKKAIDDQLNRGNVDVIQKLEDVSKVLNNYNKPELKRLPLTPLQLSLMDFPSILMLLDGKTSTQDYSMLWGKSSMDTKYNNNWDDNATTNAKRERDNVHGSAWNANNNTNNTSEYNTDMDGGDNTDGDNTAVPEVIQKFLYSRAMLDAAMNDMVDYLTVNQGFNELIHDIQRAQKDMNLI